MWLLCKLLMKKMARNLIPRFLFFSHWALILTLNLHFILLQALKLYETLFLALLLQLTFLQTLKLRRCLNFTHIINNKNPNFIISTKFEVHAAYNQYFFKILTSLLFYTFLVVLTFNLLTAWVICSLTLVPLF